MTLQWTAPASNNGSTLTGYRIALDRNGILEPERTVGVTTTAVLTGLVNNADYRFAVTPMSNRGNGVRSDFSPAFVVGLPGPPTNVTAQSRDRAAQINFNLPTTGNLNAHHYVIEAYRGTNPDAQFTTVGNGRAQLFTGLVNGVAYKFRVKGVSYQGGSGAFSAFSAPLVVGTPTKPAKPTATPGNSSVTLQWSPSGPNGSAVTKYVVTPKVGGVAQPARNVSGNATSVTITGLKNGKTFSFTVKAFNSRGSSPASSSSGSVVIGGPGPPTAVTAKAGSGKAVVSWKPPSANGAPITGYVITPYRAGSPRPPKTVAGSATSATVTGLDSASYTFVVAAKNSRGTGVKSAKTKAVVVG